jgi:hypothetical protein
MAAQKWDRYPVPATQAPVPVPEPEHEIPSWPELVGQVYRTNHPEPTIEQEETTAMTATTTTAPDDRLALASAKINDEFRQLGDARAYHEAQIERANAQIAAASAELELLEVRESELNDALKAIDAVERLLR